MKPKQNYKNLINRNIITTDMLVDCLYSVNKRAKNYRDQERISEFYSSYGRGNYRWEEKNREKKEEYYRMKDRLLSIADPTCIHVEYITHRVRYYEYELDMEEFIASDVEVVDSGECYDRETREYVQFFDVMEKESRYYLFYDFGRAHTFHTPIDDPRGYKLPMVEIGRLVTTGDNIEDLISVQFVRKVLDLIESGDFTYEQTVSSPENQIVQVQDETTQKE